MWGWRRREAVAPAGDIRLANLRDAIAALESVQSSLEQERAEQESPINQVAEGYGDDAASATRMSNRLLGASAALLAVLLLSSYALASIDNGGSGVAAVTITSGWAGLLVVGLLCAVQALRYRKIATESTRLQRQLQTLACLSHNTTAYDKLVRFALLHRVFPRSVDNRDPLSEPDWLTGEDVRAMWADLDLRSH